MLKSFVRGFLIEKAISFNTLGEIPSGSGGFFLSMILYWSQTLSSVISISDKISLFNGGGPGKWRGMSDSSVIIKPHVPSVIGSSE